MDAIVAGTRLGAEGMRMHDQIGTLEPGNYADLIVVDGNPLEDISLLEDRRNITHVMKGGEFIRQSDRGPARARPEPVASGVPSWASW
jgi:imidazolonepropionase-like amidohydrolase